MRATTASSRSITKTDAVGVKSLAAQAPTVRYREKKNNQEAEAPDKKRNPREGGNLRRGG